MGIRDYTKAGEQINELFIQKFGNSFIKRVRRKIFGYTKEENAFVFSFFGGLTKERPKWAVRSMD